MHRRRCALCCFDLSTLRSCGALLLRFEHVAIEFIPLHFIGREPQRLGVGVAVLL